MQAPIDAKRRLQKQTLEQLASIPDNTNCFDCGTNKPRWTSVNNGVFICTECIPRHRLYGTHVSQIRSVGLDQWSDENTMYMNVGGNKLAADYLIARGLTLPSRVNVREDLIEIYQKHLEGYRFLLKLRANYYSEHGYFYDDDGSYTENNDTGVPSLLNLAIEAGCKTKGFSDQILQKNADFLRPRIIETLISQRKLFGDKISLIRSNIMCSLDLDGTHLTSEDIATIARNCPELQSFRLTFFTGNLSLGLSSLISYCPKLVELELEFCAIQLDATKFIEHMMPFSINLQQLSMMHSIFIGANTFPALQDLLFLCNSLKLLKLASPKKGTKAEEIYPFIIDHIKVVKLV